MAHSSQRVPLSVLPRVPGLCLVQTAIDAETITFTLASTQTPVPCPLCGTPTARRHSQYERTVADLPWGRHAVRLYLRVRRFRCPVPTCRRRVFTERLPTLVAPYGRQTLRLRDVLGVVVIALGGEAGARLLARLGMSASPATLLRLIRRMTPPSHPPVRVIGVDDFALRRGWRYNSAYKVAQSALEFTVSVPRAPLRERYGSGLHPIYRTSADSHNPLERSRSNSAGGR